MNYSNFSIHKNFELIKTYRFLENVHIKKTIKIFNECLWYEIFEKIKKQREFDMSIKNANNSYFSYLANLNSFLRNNVSSILFSEKIVKLPENLIIICIDEYLNGRKRGFQFQKTDFLWSKKSWKNLEELFEKILIQFVYQENFNLTIFFLIESLRYDKIASIIPKQVFDKKLLSFFDCSNKECYTKKHRKLLITILKCIQKHYSTDSYKTKTNEQGFFFIDFLYNVFIEKGEGVVYTLTQTLKIHSEGISYYKISGDLFKHGILNNDVFWCLKISRSFLTIFQLIISKIILEEVAFIISTNLDNSNTSVNLKTLVNTKCKSKNVEICNLIKIGVIFSINILTIESSNTFQLIDFIQSLDSRKLNTWLKFLTGISLSLINRKNVKFYQVFLELIEKNWFSGYLRGGLLIGMGMNIREYNNFKELFLEKYFTALKTGYYQEEDNFNMVKNGINLGLSIFNKMSSKDNSKENFFWTLVSDITVNSKTGQSSALSLGLYFQDDKSKYILKNVLKLTKLVENEKIIKFLFVSLTIIYSKDKEIAGQLFDKFILSKNPLVRSGAVYIYTLAFYGSANHRIVKKILEIVSKDLDNVVKKACIIGLGFLFFSKFSLFKEIITQFVYHHNPFIRYGASIAIAISSFYNNSDKAHELLHVLSNDKIDFVRQGSLIALGLSIQEDQNMSRKKKLRVFFKKKLAEENDCELTIFGTVIGYSLNEISIKKNSKLRNQQQNKNKSSDIIKLFLFIQHWDWIPCLYFISL
nr:26S proteasome regulatory subunit [Cryptomonas sp.]